jgi:hypothetical protein
VAHVELLVTSGERDDRVQLEAALAIIAHVHGQPARRKYVSGPEGAPIQSQTVHVRVIVDDEGRTQQVEVVPQG